MRILLSSSLAIAGMMSLPAAVSPLQTENRPAPDLRNDPRVHTLRSFFSASDCPASNYSEHFVGAADHYDLDWRLLPSISYVESTGGKRAPHNNMFGWDSGRAKFTSPAAGIYAVGYRLSRSKLYRGKDLDDLLATYNPNAEYAQRVKFVMRQISRGE